MSPFRLPSRAEHSRDRGTKGYIAALVLTLLAAGAKLALNPALGDQLPYSTYFLAVIIAVWYARATAPALVAVVGGAIASQWTTIEPAAGASVASSAGPLTRLAVYLALALIVVVFARALQTARDKAEQLADEYDQQRERLSVTLSSIGDAVMVADASGGVTYLNRLGERLTGWTHLGAAGMPVEQVFHIIDERTRQPIESPFTRAVRDGVTAGLANHTVLIARDGTERSIEDTAAPILDTNGQVAGAILIFRDVTERRTAERELAEARSHAETIVDTVPEPIVILDGSLRIVRANRSFYRAFNLAPIDVEGHGLQEIGTGEWNLPLLVERIGDVHQTGAELNDLEVDVEFDVLGARIVLLNARRIHESVDRSHLVLLAIEDITDRRRMERKLSDSEERYRLVVEGATGFALVMLDLDGCVISWNIGAERLLGYTESEIMGADFARFFTAEDRAAGVPQRELDAAARFEEGPDDNWLVRKDGSRFWASGATTALRDETGALRGFTKVVRDVTDRRRAHEAMQEADRRKDEFLATLAHELRNPLAPMRTALHLMQQNGPPNADWQVARNVLERQTRQMTRLIDDLLEVSRISQGRMILQRQPIELNDVLQQAIETSRPLIERHRHRLIMNLPSQTAMIHGDPARLTQVFANLLDNAAKYQDSGGLIELSAEVAGDQVLVSVRDDGIGLTPEQMTHIFEMFMQVESSMDRSQGGLGIGLSLVKRLVELHGGAVSVQSSGLGLGSTFLVNLPVTLYVRDAEEGEGDEPVAIIGPGTRRVLVVDDNLDAASTVAMLMELSGHIVRVANDGERALVLADEFRPEFVLLDVGLPKMNGYEVCRHLRAQPWAQQVVIVALTGWGQADDRRRSEAAGFDRHLVKPVDPDLLVRLLTESWVSARRGLPQA